MSFNFELNFSNLLKLIILILLLTAHIIFIINEHNKPEELRVNSENLKSGVIDNKSFKSIVGILAGSIAAISGGITIKNELLAFKNTEHFNKAIEENNQLKATIEQLEEKLTGKYSSNNEINNSAGKILDYLNQCKISVNTMNENYNKLIQIANNSKKNSQILDDVTQINGSTEKAFKALNVAKNAASQEANNIISLTEEAQTKFVILSDYMEFLDKFNGFGKLFIGLLIFKYVILSCCISILSIIYGNYLIDRFNIEGKYPRIYKLLSLRIKYQRYYILLNLSIIAIAALIELLIILYLLY